MFQEKTSASDEKIKKLLSLFRYFFDKNDLCRAFFKAANQQVALGQSRVLSFFASLINHDEDPDYVLFLLEKGLISPTECVGVFRKHFISLQPYLANCELRILP